MAGGNVEEIGNCMAHKTRDNKRKRQTGVEPDGRGGLGNEGVKKGTRSTLR